MCVSTNLLQAGLLSSVLYVYKFLSFRNFLICSGNEKNKLEKIFELENMVADVYAKSENEKMNHPSRTTIIESLTTSAWDYEYGTRWVCMVKRSPVVWRQFTPNFGRQLVGTRATLNVKV